MSGNMPNALANGRYQLGQLIGRGGMAEVRVALDSRLGRTVAIKIMRSDLANDEIFLSRFRREAHAVAQMNNPNIVNIYDSGEETFVNESGGTERLPYLVMEYVKGQTLRDIIKANGPLSQRDAEQVMLGVLNALEYSHRMGIIHRDIKPGNIMISEQGVVKVMDFGIARALDDSAATMTQSQGVVGTAQYLSPEQARGETVDMRSDLYSAGCVLYEMLTGRPPFTGDSAVAIAYQHVSEVATPPSALVPGLPKMWDSICAKAMAKDRQNRYATAAEFKNDILTFMNGGVPVAAAFNPLTDLSNMKARKQEELNQPPTATVPMGDAGAPTQAFNPLAGANGMNGANGANGMSPYGNPYGTQYGMPPADPNAAANAALKSRAEQRAAAAQAKRRKQIIIGSILGVIALIAIVVGVMFAMNQANATKMVTVPTFSAQTNAELAKQKLEAVGLKIQTMQDSDSSEPEGTFTKQDPAGGSQVEEGSTVRVWFSTGPQQVAIPDVKNMSQEDARAELKDKGFDVQESTQTQDSADVEKDKVTGTSPAIGTIQAKGTTVMLYVSTGMTTVPDVTGQTQEKAQDALKSFTVVIEHETSADVEKGSVVRTDPVAGSPIAQKSTITVYISDGKEKVTVPTVAAGTATATAKAALEAQGFKVKITGPTDGVVVSISPDSGESVDEGSTITIVSQADPNANTPGTGDDNNNTGTGTNTNGTNNGGGTNSNGTTTGE
ncbi:Stk1 family PASTA domain-containing Ser/Thr kinase [Bifidobacterium jacchi]|uniref:non-specific serine/threonine protein kinase n=1 Tax=Bifidobacterium jacchi TaxID=2490545 RepID=A0A5N5RL11_9BIFI|nr:Stk1 family PASTA domain-containing Ser/Thr kinase [Bifidobacterium jacchi]KAB5607823.1 Stk1 family PASTA domain-containing Ser/Thr kinase [Bifidobacterium jacchi]